MKWIRNIVKNMILNSILHECSLGSDNEMDSEHGKKHDSITFCMNPASGATMKWIRNLVKNMMFT